MRHVTSRMRRIATAGDLPLHPDAPTPAGPTGSGTRDKAAVLTPTHTCKFSIHGKHALSAAHTYPRSPALSAVSTATCRLNPQHIDETERGAQRIAGELFLLLRCCLEPRRHRKLRQLTGKLSDIPASKSDTSDFVL